MVLALVLVPALALALVLVRDYVLPPSLDPDPYPLRPTAVVAAERPGVGGPAPEGCHPPHRIPRAAVTCR